MDYSMLKTIHSSVPENLTVHPVYANYMYNGPHHHQHHLNPDANIDRVNASMSRTSPAQTPASSDADDLASTMMMDCSRSSSSAISPHPPALSRLTGTPIMVSLCHSPGAPVATDASASATAAAALPSVTNTSSDSTKLKLNFSMDRILSRVETAFCPPNRRIQFESGIGTCLGCDSSHSGAPHVGGHEDAETFVGYDRLTMNTEQQRTIGAGVDPMFAPGVFSVASMLGLTAATATTTTTGGKPIFRPMPVYVSQSGPTANTTPVMPANYLSSHNVVAAAAAALYSMPARPTANDRRHHHPQSHPVCHTHHPHQHHLASHPHPHLIPLQHQQQQQQSAQQHMHQQQHMQHHHSHIQHQHQHQPTGQSQLTIVEANASAAASNANGSNNAKRKRSWSRAVFSQLQRKGLEIQFQIQKYITKPDRRKLAARLSLTDAQVKVWFQNRRMKWRHTRENKLGGNSAQMPGSKPSAAVGSVCGDDLKHETDSNSSSDEDEIDVVAE